MTIAMPIHKNFVWIFLVLCYTTELCRLNIRSFSSFVNHNQLSGNTATQHKSNALLIWHLKLRVKYIEKQAKHYLSLSHNSFTTGKNAASRNEQSHHSTQGSRVIQSVLLHCSRGYRPNSVEKLALHQSPSWTLPSSEVKSYVHRYGQEDKTPLQHSRQHTASESRQHDIRWILDLTLNCIS